MRESRKLHKVKLIKTLKELKPEDQSNIIRYLNTEALDIVGECFHNIVSTDLKLKKCDKRKLKDKLPGNEKVISYISKKSNCPEKRRRKLLQTGISKRISLHISYFMLMFSYFFQEDFFLLCWQWQFPSWQALFSMLHLKKDEKKIVPILVL